MMDAPRRALVLLTALMVAGLLAPKTLVAQSGSVQGTISLEGEPPTPETLTVTSDQGFCGDSLRAHDVLIQSGRVENVVVWIEGAQGEPQPRRRRLLNTDCRFLPRVMAAAVGDTLVIINQDSVLHNTNLEQTFTGDGLRGRSRALGNFSLPLAGMTVKKPDLLRLPGWVEVTCDAHAWMEGQIRVFDHPYFGVTDRTGTYTIEGLPSGTYKLTAWHEVLGKLERTVTVEAGQTARTDLTFTG